jgi:hypothetical protein
MSGQVGISAVELGDPENIDVAAGIVQNVDNHFCVELQVLLAYPAHT